MPRESGGIDPALVIAVALKEGRTALSEYESKAIVSVYGATVVEERLCGDIGEAAAWAEKVGRPVALKLCSPDVAHKKEMGFVAVGLSGRDEIARAGGGMLARAEGIRIDGFLVQRVVSGERELLAGMRRDPVFGVCVTLGFGGIFTEAFGDVSVRVAPVSAPDAAEMLDELRAHRVFGEYRGLPAVNREMIFKTLAGLGEIGFRHPEVREVDINPLIVDERGRPVAVDALVILSRGGGA